ncbi:MAG: penicillin acylase family protein [Cyclobacteriaceae bacterium]|nr:penicillin acylase family protein [Cyclobacteriaceae bacterium]
MTKLTLKLFLTIALVSTCLSIQAQINPQNIDIVRDKWGVPHIFAKTDAEVAYGFGWATAEDDFKTMQEQLLPIRGVMGMVYGNSGAAADVAVHIIEAHQLVDSRYEKEVSPEFRAYLDGFCSGINAYAKKYPKEVLHRKLFPVESQDVIKAFVLAMTWMSHTVKDIQDLTGNKVKAIKIPEATGSNAFAVTGKKTADGKTYLAVNAHQPLEGLNSFYEAHLCSEEGLNILGGTFSGSPVISLGSNNYLGWAHTLNYPDFSDIFQLEMHPEEKLTYKLDGKWEKLEPYHTKAHIKILGFLKVGAKQKFYKSKFGVTFETDNGFFALRFPANRTIKTAEQWFRMGKSTNWSEFRSALEMQGIAASNIVYADGEGHIYYLSNGRFPIRNPNYDWKGVVSGNTAATLWGDEIYPLDSLPHVLDPESGYVYNCNHSPFLSSAIEDNPKLESVPSTMGFQQPESLTNRAVRFYELFNKLDKVSYQDFKRIKYDRSYHTPLKSAPKLEPIFHLDPDKYPEIKESILLLANWNREAVIESEAATLFNLAVDFLKRKIKNPAHFREGDKLNEALLVEAIIYARNYCNQYFGSVHVPLKKLQRHTRGSVNLPVSGGTDVLAALSASKQEDGTLRARAGDSYIQLARFSEKGVEIESVHAYGSSAKPASPHYTDQMQMYVNRELKTMTINKEEVLKSAKQIYHPE